MSANAIADHDPTQAVATACDVVAPALTIGGWKQTRAPRMDNEVVDLIKKHKIPAFVIEQDLAARGNERGELVPEVELLSSKILPKRMAEQELVSHW
jgi:hypothetical protein